MKVWIVAQDVDLGYHVNSLWLSQESANAEYDRLVKEHEDEGNTWEHAYFVMDMDAQS